MYMTKIIHRALASMIGKDTRGQDLIERALLAGFVAD